MMAGDYPSPFLFRVTKSGQSAGFLISVLEFGSEAISPNCIIFPTWMFDTFSLDSSSLVTIEPLKTLPPLCTDLKLLPDDSERFRQLMNSITNPRALLETVISDLTTLTIFQRICIQHEWTSLWCTVIDLQPQIPLRPDLEPSVLLIGAHVNFEVMFTDEQQIMESAVPESSTIANVATGGSSWGDVEPDEKMPAANSSTDAHQEISPEVLGELIPHVVPQGSISSSPCVSISTFDLQRVK